MERSHRAGTLLLLAGGLTVACSVPSPQRSPPPGGAQVGSAPSESRHWEWTVPPDGMAEINVDLAEGTTMAADFAVTGAGVTWNVHSHEEKGTVIHSQGTEPRGTARFLATKAGVYSCLWVNGGKAPARIEVDLRLQGQGRVHSAHP